MAKVILAYAQNNDGGDNHRDYMSIEFEVIDESKLTDINSLMSEYYITEWLDKPDFDKPEAWESGQASLLEFRPFTVKPIRVVQSWQLIRNAK